MSDALFQRMDSLPELQQLLGTKTGELSEIPTGAFSMLAAWLLRRAQCNVVLVSNDAEELFSDARLFLPEESVALWPAADTPAFDRIPPSDEVTRHRLRTLNLLRGGGPVLVIAAATGLLRPTVPVELMEQSITLRRGATVPRDAATKSLIALGYRRVNAVTAPGEFAVRGGIVDVFTFDGRPWRAEWFGSEIDDLRTFDVASQTSVGKVEDVSLSPARELDLRPENVARALAELDKLDLDSCRDDVAEAWRRDIEQLRQGIYDEGVDRFFPYLAGEAMPSLFDHLGDKARVLVAGGTELVMRSLHRIVDEMEKLKEQEEEQGELPKDSWAGALTTEWLQSKLSAAINLVRESEARAAIALGWSGAENFANQFERAAQVFKTEIEAGRAVAVVSRQKHRVEELATEHGVAAAFIERFTDAIPSPSIQIVDGELSDGFLAPSLHLAVWSERELFGIHKVRASLLSRGARHAESTSARGRRTVRSRNAAEAFVLQFEPGDVVAHRDHGIGKFIEMRRVADESGAEHEYMVLEYSEGDRLLVPTEHLDRVDRYVGGGGAPTLSKLGTGEWERTKRRVKERTEKVARDLLEMYSRREMAAGHPFPPDTEWQHELELSFPWEETPDQVLVLEEIKRDMEQSKPMDRVVCGDVGFGKTELALRAAFKSVNDGRQVAVLVPTTVLCQQHFLTFSERLKAFPIRLKQLSRFCTPDEERATILGLNEGTVDIVIGTHRLLQPDIQFRNLGLVIIDEEQRFGVLQKEKFKQLRIAVDILSLSATPIPRTLHMSLAGLRDLSVIQTPPEERQPIKTYVTERNDELVREVIIRELTRGGQVFYVHNRVQTIEREAEWIRKLVPEARVAIAHGQMHEDLLAAAMKQFVEGEIDVLVASTIIESGLDIPNANTIIINDAHRLGLAQLYQLRGRVGRAGQRAYAYFLYPEARALTERADKRLEVIGELQDLGAGFRLAMKDLEIRGAGNLLGEEQSGEIAAVGLELYNFLLRQAVATLQGKPIVESPAHITISLPIAAFLPAAYIDDEQLRLRCYRELAGCTTESELEKSAASLQDRFGPLPSEAKGLVYSLRVRLLAAACNAASIESSRGGVMIQLSLQHGLDLESVARQYRAYVATSPSRLFVIPPPGRSADAEWQDVLLRVLREMGRLVRMKEAAQQPAATHA